MTEREPWCQLCADTLDLACREWQGDWCTLRERYLAGEATGDDVLYELYRRLSPEQVAYLRERLRERGWA